MEPYIFTILEKNFFFIVGQCTCKLYNSVELFLFYYCSNIKLFYFLLFQFFFLVLLKVSIMIFESENFNKFCEKFIFILININNILVYLYTK